MVGVAPLQQTQLAVPESLNQKPLQKAGAIFMCVTCISTCGQACTFTHSCASTLKYLQSARSHVGVLVCIPTRLGDQIMCMKLDA